MGADRLGGSYNSRQNQGGPYQQKYVPNNNGQGGSQPQSRYNNSGRDQGRDNYQQNRNTSGGSGTWKRY